jgi:hypothetical protein
MEVGEDGCTLHSRLKRVQSQRKPPNRGLFTVIDLRALKFGRNLLQNLINNQKVLFAAAAAAAAAAVAAVKLHISFSIYRYL